MERSIKYINIYIFLESKVTEQSDGINYYVLYFVSKIEVKRAIGI